MRENDCGEMSLETDYATLDAEAIGDPPLDESSVYSCPDGGGVLREVDAEDLLRFCCRVGHAYSADGVVDAQGESIETALWTPLPLQERAQLADRLAERVGKAGAERSRRRFEGIAEEARGQAETIRRLLARSDGPED